MKHANLISHFKSLPASEQSSVLKSLYSYFESSVDTIHDLHKHTIIDKGLYCSHCDSSDVVKYGKYKLGHRYKCKTCSKTFSSFTGTIAHGLHDKQKLKQYLYYMLNGYSLRKISFEMDICLKTSFDWRHKILSGLNTVSNQRMSGVVEADETFFLNSNKGNKSLQRTSRKRGGVASKKGINKDHVTVMTVFERSSKMFVNTVVCKGRLTKKAIEKGVGQWLSKTETILCSDSHKSFEGFAMDNELTHKRIFVRRKEYVKERIYHIQNVNRIHHNLKKWIEKFHGVSTKYLQHYLNYFSLVERLKNQISYTNQALKEVVEKRKVYLKREAINQQRCIT